METINYTQLKSNSTYYNSGGPYGNYIKLTSTGTMQRGHVFYNTPVHFADEQNNLIDWSAYYVTGIGGGDNMWGQHGDGMGFSLVSTLTGMSTYSQNLFAGRESELFPKTITVFYNTVNSTGWGNDRSDPNGNTIELNNILGSMAYPIAFDPDPGFEMHSTNPGRFLYNWVDYVSGTLKIYISLTNSKPATPRVSYAINLKNYIGSI
jgi:hypothetical protein